MVHPDHLRRCLTHRQLNDWRERAHKIGNKRADERTILNVAGALAPWSKEVKLGPMLRDFSDEKELVSEDEWQEIAAAAKAKNAERFPDGYPDSWTKPKTNRTL